MEGSLDLVVNGGHANKRVCERDGEGRRREEEGGGGKRQYGTEGIVVQQTEGKEGMGWR